MHMMDPSHPWPSVSFGTYRTWDTWNLSWKKVETSRGVYNWSNFDHWVDLAKQNNKDIIYTFGATPQWAAVNPNNTNCFYGSGACEPPANMTDWEDYVRAVVTHSAGRVKYWEIWNEPVDVRYFNGSVTTLADMARRAYSIIKSIDPNAVVLTPCPTGGNSYGSNWLNTYFAAGGGNYADVVAFHGYWEYKPAESIITLVKNYKAVMSAYGLSNKPMFDTESGWGETSWLADTSQRPAFVARHYLLHWSLGVSRYNWYAWDNGSWGTMWDPTAGILAPGVAYREVYKWMVGAVMSSACASSDNAQYTCGFTRAGGYQALAVWNTTGAKSFNVPTQYSQYRKIDGSVVAVTGPYITIDQNPILLETNTSTPPPPPTTSTVTVSISSPVSGSSAASPSTVAATATSSSATITGWKIYVNSVAQWSCSNCGTSIAASVPLTKSINSITVRAWDSTGANGSQNIKIHRR
jgi:polysaccharide biosynthesis protein PslG